MDEIFAILYDGRFFEGRSIFERLIENNSLVQVGIALALFVGTFLVLTTAKCLIGKILKKVSEKTKSWIPKYFSKTIEQSGKLFFSIIALYTATLNLDLALRLRFFCERILIIALILQIARWLNQVVKLAVEHYQELHQKDSSSASRIPTRFIGMTVRAILWAIAFALILQIIGFDVTGLVAGLGLSGIVVALAAQNIVADLFASLMIIVDRPFVVGDVISLEDMIGIVESIGIKTTRVRSLNGELLLFSNQELLKTNFRNYTGLVQRRSVFKLRVAYGTSAELLERIPEMVREVVESVPDARFDRTHFASYAESSLDFEVSIYIACPSYVDFANRLQQVNIGIYKAFDEKGIRFGMPIRIVHQDEGSRPVEDRV